MGIASALRTVNGALASLEGTLAENKVKIDKTLGDHSRADAEHQAYVSKEIGIVRNRKEGLIALESDRSVLQSYIDSFSG
eukprot:15023664-Alexandrium_andersonii.AAC.1